MKLHVAPRPCPTCPYRVDHPSGVWHADEYAKLPTYDDGHDPVNTATFLCHQSRVTDRDSVCRGWLTVHAESVAARLATLLGLVTDNERYAPVDVELYPSGRAACDAGLAAIDSPSPDATVMARKLINRQIGTE